MYKKRIEKMCWQKIKKILSVYLITLMVVSGFLGIVKNVKADGSGNYPAPKNGDWVITNNTFVGNETIILNGNLTIENGGSLELRNVTLIMNCTEDGEFGILVKDGGKLYILDFDNNPKTKYDRCNITAFDKNFEFKFLVDSSAEFEMRNSELSECGYTSSGEDDGRAGLTIKANNTIIENSTFYYNCYGIYFFYSNNNTIINNNISNNSRGIFFLDSGNNQIINNNISNNDYGVYLYKSNDNQISNSSISNSSNYDFYLKSNSNINAINTTFNKDKIYFDDKDSELIVKWYLSVKVVDKNRNAIPDANIRIQDNKNGTFDKNFTTDSKGFVKWLELTEYINNTNGQIYYNPYNIIAVKYGVENSTEIEIDKNKEITLILDLESKNWIINTTEIYENQEIILDKNLIIEKGGNLTFKSVTLKMDCSYDGEYRIEVKEGGEFYILSKEKKHGDYDLTVGEYDGNLNYFRNIGTTENPIWDRDDSFYSGINVGKRSTPMLVDIDNDKDFDLFIGEEEGNLNFVENIGSTTNPIWGAMDENYAGIDIGSRSSPTLVDIDNDKDFDLFIGEEDGSLNFVENIGTPTNPKWASIVENYEGISVGSYSNPTFADLDGDKDYDLFIGESKGRIKVYRNIGTPTTPSWQELGFLRDNNKNEIDVGQGSAPTFIDIDDDNDLDLIIGEREQNQDLNFYRNIGNATFPKFAIETSPFSGTAVGWRSTPVFADLDDDGEKGAPSIITANNTKYKFKFLVNKGAKFVMKNSKLSECGYTYNGEEDGRDGLTIKANNTLIENSTFYNNYCGIYVYKSLNNKIINNNFYNNSYGILLHNSTNNIIKNNNVYSNNEYGIYLPFSSSNNKIENNIISNNSYGIDFYSSSNNNDIINNTLFKNNYGIIIHTSINNKIINSTISSTSYDFYLVLNSTITTLNTTFDKDKVYFEDEKSELTVKWYLSINVVDKNGFEVENANILIKNKFGTEKYNGTTNKYGWIKWIEIPEYKENSAGGTEFSPYNITISKRKTKVFENVSFDSPTNKSQILTVKIPIVGERFGFSTSNAGDLNNDGYDDIIVGAPYNDINGYNAGAVYIFYGYYNFNSTYLDPKKANVTLVGEKGSLFGFSVSFAGDVNNDGNDDIIVGAPNASVDKKRKGCAYIFYGKDLKDGIHSYNEANITITGRYEGDRFGSIVSGIGDFNKDSYDDVAVIAYSHEIEKGLIAEYYDNNNFTNLVARGIDNKIDFDWGSGKAHENMSDSDQFSARWKGKIYCPQNDDYTFYMKADDRDRLKIDNFQLFYDTNENTEEKYTIYLTKGWHDILVEMVELSGDANVYLMWESSIIPKEVISEEYLFHDYGEGVANIFFGPINDKTARNASITLQNNLISSIASGDFNDDGYDDIVAGSKINNKVYIYYGGNDTFYGDRYLNLWDMEKDWETFEIDFTSGVNTTANTFGAGNGDDGWDWANRVYGDTTKDMTSFHSTSGVGDGKTHDSSARIEVEVGNKGDESDDGYRDSGAWGIQVYLTPKMYENVEKGAKVIVSFDWEAYDTAAFGPSDEENGITEERCYVKARFGNSSAMNYLGRNMYGDAEAEIWGGRSYNIPFHESGHFTEDVTRYVKSPGFYYLDLGAKFDANLQGWYYHQYPHEGIRAYFDNISIKISYDTTIALDGNGKFGFSVASCNLNNDSYKDIIVSSPAIDKTYIYYGSKDGIAVNKVSYDTASQFQKGTYDTTLVGQGYIKLRYNESENIVKNGWFNNGWENWSYGANTQGDDNAGRNDHSTPNGMVTEKKGDWIIATPPGEPPTAGFGSDTDTIGWGETKASSGMIKSSPFYIPNYVNYLHTWHHWKCYSFDSQQYPPDGFYLRIFNASNDEPIITIAEHIATSNGQSWNEAESIVTDISSYHGYHVYVGLEIQSNEGQQDKALAQLDEVYSCDKDGNPVYIKKGYYVSQTIRTKNPILGVIPEWIDKIPSNSNMIIRIRADNSVSWEEAKIAKNHELLIFDTPGKKLQYNVTFITQDNMSTPLLYHISLQYFSNNLPTIIEGIENDSFGYSVSYGGELNNDGIDDIIIGSPFNDERGKDAGAVYTFYGNDSLDNYLYAKRSFGMYYGKNANDNFGYSLSYVGKINDEKYQKAVVGSPNFENYNGKVYLVGIKNIDVGVMSIDTPKRNELLWPGKEIDINATIANFGTTIQNNIEVHLDIKCIEDSGNNHEEIKNIPVINVGKFENISFKWTVPSGYENKNYIISIYTLLANDMQENNDKKVIPTKARGHNVFLMCKEKYKSVRAGESIDYIIKVENTGNLGDDTITLNAEYPNDWTAKFFYENNEITKIDLGEGKYKEINFRLKTIENATHGYEYKINITGLSKNGYSKSIIVITTRIKQTDLEPIDIKFFRKDGVEVGIDKHAIANEETTINATIINNGDTYATNLTVTFYKNETIEENIIGETIVEIVPTDKEAYAEIKWNASAGTHKITVEVDKNLKFLESNEANNKYFETISFNSTKPSKPYIIWVKVQYKDSKSVVNGFVAVKNLNTGEILTNQTNENGKCKFIFANYTEGDKIQIVATNPKIENEDIPEGTFFSVKNIFAYSDDSNDDNSDFVKLQLEKHGILLETLLDDETIGKESYAKFEVFIKVPSWYVEGEEVVTIKIDNIPKDWGAMLKCNELYTENNQYKLDVNKLEWIEVDLFVYPPKNGGEKEANISFSVLPDSCQLPLWYIEEFSPYSLFFKTKVNIYNTTLKIINEYNETSIYPDEKIIYSIELKNNGNARDTVSLSFSGENQNWAYLSDSELTINSGDSKIVYLTINVPEDAKSSDKSVIYLWAVSKDGTKSNEITITTNVIEKKHEIKIVLEKVESNGYQSEYYLKIVNKGEIKENVFLEAVTTKNWKGELNNTFLVMDVGEIAYICMKLIRLTNDWGSENDTYIKAKFGDENETKLILNKPPYASIVLRINNPVPNLVTIKSKINCDGQLSIDEEESKLKFTWDFGDGIIEKGKELTHEFKLAGNYTVTLIVEDSLGLKDIAKREIFVANYYSPKIKVIWPKNESVDLEEEEIIKIKTNETLVLDASQSTDEDGYIVRYTWYCKGNIKDGKMVYWNYSEPGDYEIILTVEDNFGKTKDLTIYVHVEKGKISIVSKPKEKEDVISSSLFYIMLLIVIILAILISIALVKIRNVSRKVEAHEPTKVVKEELKTEVIMEKEVFPTEISKSKEEELEEGFERKREPSKEIEEEKPVFEEKELSEEIKEEKPLFEEVEKPKIEEEAMKKKERKEDEEDWWEKWEKETEF